MRIPKIFATGEENIYEVLRIIPSHNFRKDAFSPIKTEIMDLWAVELEADIYVQQSDDQIIFGKEIKSIEYEEIHNNPSGSIERIPK